jgi:ABC-2 type transport system ATP-binding protein
MAATVLDLRNVQKIYKGRVEALRGISLQVAEGSIFGLLGPNGAGKSTLVKILTTIIHPTRCEGTMLGYPVGHKPTLRQVGYLPEHARFPAYLTGRQVIQYAAGLAGVRVNRERLRNLLKLVGMEGASERTLKTYSKGMVQRIGFAQALVNDPQLVFLDEPTDGVDPEGRRVMRELLLKLRSEGRTVFVNSHLLGELETVCDSIAILKEGSVVRQGALAELTGGSCRFEIITAGPIGEEVAERFRTKGLVVEERRVEVSGGDAEPVQPVLDALRSGGSVITEVRQVRQSLEDLFLESVADESGRKGKESS